MFHYLLSEFGVFAMIRVRVCSIMSQGEACEDGPSGIFTPRAFPASRPAGAEKQQPQTSAKTHLKLHMNC
jgi:hypothetical protein